MSDVKTGDQYDEMAMEIGCAIAKKITDDINRDVAAGRQGNTEVDVVLIANALRSVERRTAEECAKIVLETNSWPWTASGAIRERFHLDGK